MNNKMKKCFVLLDGKPLIRGCSVIALFINADGLRMGIHGSDPKALFTSEDVWESGQNGELYGILFAMRYLEKVLNKEKVQKDFLPNELKSVIQSILDTGIEPLVDWNAVGDTWFTGIGKECAQIL